MSKTGLKIVEKFQLLGRLVRPIGRSPMSAPVRDARLSKIRGNERAMKWHAESGSTTYRDSSKWMCGSNLTVLIAK